MELTKLDKDRQTQNVNSYQDKIEDMESTLAEYKKQLTKVNQENVTKTLLQLIRQRAFVIIMFYITFLFIIIFITISQEIYSTQISSQDLIIGSALIAFVGVVLIFNERTK